MRMFTARIAQFVLELDQIADLVGMESAWLSELGQSTAGDRK